MPPKKRQKKTAVESKTTMKAKDASSSKTEKMNTATSKLLNKVYGVTFPADLYAMWEFCCELNKSKPLQALSSLGLELVGPFEVISRDLTASAPNSINYHLHWRFYYDPPELLTVFVSNNPKENPFHIGYLRDDPNDEKCIVVSNSGENCKIDILGDNLFCAVNIELGNKISSAKGKDKTLLQNISKKVIEYAKSIKINLQAYDNVEERRKHIVGKTFHNAGIVVPLDENEVGYRPVGETPAGLKKMFQKIDEADDENRMFAFDDIQELVTYVQLANDECDFGMGLELGMNMFCYGSRYLNKAASRMLSMAYSLLKKDLYQKIIEHHLSDRRRQDYARLPEATE